MAVTFAIVVSIWAQVPWFSPWFLLVFLVVGGWGAWATMVLRFNKVDEGKVSRNNG